MLAQTPLTAVVVIALGLTPVSARSYATRTTNVGLGLASRQLTTDVCANVNGDLVTGGIDFGNIQTCLCASAIPEFISANAVAQASVQVVGVQATVDALNALINASPDSETCNYPANSVPQCTADDPCAFTCTNGFTASPANNPDSCVCASPNVICDGVCQANACPSGVSPNGRRAYGASLRKRAMCPGHLTACGAYERRGAKSDPWECVDTLNDLESCGGCVTPLDRFSPRGTDCSAIPGVVDVACNAGSCIVRRCMEGYVVADDMASCVRAGSKVFQQIQQI